MSNANLYRATTKKSSPNQDYRRTKLKSDFSFMQKPNWDTLYQVASSQAGYFTNAQAHQSGYSDQLILYHIKGGRFERVLRKVYRLVHFPPSDHENLVAIFLWAETGVFSHETALALHQRSDCLLSQVYITLPPHWSRKRIRYPKGVIPIFAELTSADFTWYDCIPITTPLKTIQDCQETHVDPDLIRQAIKEALSRGLFQPDQLSQRKQSHG